MSKYGVNGILEHLRQELTLTEVKAGEIGNRFEVLCRETESIKVDALGVPPFLVPPTMRESLPLPLIVQPLLLACFRRIFWQTQAGVR